MKKTKLKIDNFVGNKLENLIVIVGRGDRPRTELTLEDGESGGSTVSNGSGAGHDGPTPITADIEFEIVP